MRGEEILLSYIMEKNMRLYGITDEYIRFIGKSFPRVFSNKEDERIHIRKY